MGWIGGEDSEGCGVGYRGKLWDSEDGGKGSINTPSDAWLSSWDDTLTSVVASGSVADTVSVRAGRGPLQCGHTDSERVTVESVSVSVSGDDGDDNDEEGGDGEEEVSYVSTLEIHESARLKYEGEACSDIVISDS